MSWRLAYRRVIDAEAYVDDSDLAKFTAAFDRTVEDGAQEPYEMFDRDTALASLSGWRDAQQRAWRQHFSAARHGDGTARARLIDVLLLQSAPLGLSLGSWLQGLSAPANFEDETHLSMLALLADDVGAGLPCHARRDEFGLLLKRLGHPLGTHDAPSVANARDLDDSMFALPAVLVAMSRRSERCAVELCAIDLVFRTLGMLPCWAALRDEHPHAVDWRRLDLSVGGGSTELLDPVALSLVIARLHLAKGDSQAARFDKAVRWAIASIDAWNTHLLQCCADAADARRSMALLVQKRWREAAVYHKGTRLGGCPLSNHFQQAASNPGPLVDALASSRYVKPGAPDRSPLVNGLVGPHGPMFRVFQPTELKTIREWIGSLAPVAAHPCTAAVAPNVRVGAPPHLREAESRHESSHEEAHDAPLANLRDAYFQLQGRTLTPSLRNYAVRYVGHWLTGAARRGVQTQRSLPAEWSAEGLTAWLLDQHDLHGRAFEAELGSDADMTREAAIDSTLQLAPLILIDGSWLHGFTDLELACSDVGRPLFEIYWDELGNGKIELNHPKIYRNLLQSMGVTLPPTGTRAFSADSRLRDEAFYLPVYWLCLGKLPVTYMPEILGMNLAMELSGVGDGYRSARRFLCKFGFSTQFVDLHNTIDNVATGHSAWAATAIDAYMKQAVRYGGADAIALQWQRIRTGYDSLSHLPDTKPSKRLTGALLKWWRRRSARASAPHGPRQQGAF